MTTMYQLTETYSNDTESLTLDEIEDLLDALGWMPDGGLRELADGRLVDAGWDPASAEPEVVANRIETAMGR